MVTRDYEKKRLYLHHPEPDYAVVRSRITRIIPAPSPPPPPPPMIIERPPSFGRVALPGWASSMGTEGGTS
ncbi:hypothetical protein G7Z17_g9324 [Cylindrodendrum hubeiense]|uniref:Uncharacterized protein n=1 Tax=Cylindrodendrum hubeiense TaxID=595255 RepID=A0A9P5L5T2_9HYPO|nr:hypothetical protein G7Z17_g9324 [Cylindrodendrum hubeiense]